MSVIIPGHVVFIHIPRTGGTSIETALLQAIPEAPRTPNHLRHLTAWDIRESMPIAQWERAFKFTIVRDPLQQFESIYRFVRLMAEGISPVQNRIAAGHDGDQWMRIMQRTARYPTFSEWLRHEWLGEFSPLRPGGFRRTWCLGLEGEDLGVRTFRHERLREEWPEICGGLGIQVELQHLNGAPGPTVEWTEADIAAVRAMCWMDF